MLSWVFFYSDFDLCLQCLQIVCNFYVNVDVINKCFTLISKSYIQHSNVKRSGIVAAYGDLFGDVY